MTRKKSDSRAKAPADGTRLIGYARVSTADQNVEMQLEALRNAGVLEDNLHWEKVSGVKAVRKGLEMALADAREGDTFVVYKLDRLGRSMGDLIEKVNTMAKRGVAFMSLTEKIDTNTPGGMLLFHVIGALAQFERDLIKERTRDGMQSAMRRGVKVGAKKKMTKERVREAERRLKAGESVADIAADFDVTEPTIYANISRRLVRKWKRKTD